MQPDTDKRERLLAHSGLQYLHHHHHRSRFLRQYKYFHYLRPFGILFTLLVLYLALSWADSKEMIIFFVVILALKEMIHFFFLWRLEKNIFKPMISLKQGLDEVAKGNYTTKVKNELYGDLGSVIDAFNEMTEKLYEGEKLQIEYEENRKALIANISHDLKTPITAIQGYVEALLEGAFNTGENKHKYLKTIHHNIIYVNRLIDDLFLFAKLDMQKLEFQYHCTKIRAFMEDLIAEYQFDFTEKNIQFHYDAQLEEHIQVRLDGKRFHQAISNILTNAVQYGPATGLVIQVRLYRRENFAAIDIQDNGPGIPAEKLAFVFERFYRIHTERPKEAGTGLGLAIAKELIEAHGGHITLSSMENQGSCFTILLPLWQEDQGEVVE
ncbi:putative membrane protein [Propionispora sp. 2/2-37]|uniref:sensor histidine kinase n=1 Tax=Propionispora sp. 2/2-37 TaxID=1677858 RepID=UPI0006BB8614|nr:HAMP domain-containing sensor histidine kinase [Propionispora sp. 2/2-37]CUH95278.1 putative membrane protein [Propionispora sp. 2/2-37]